MGRFNEAEAIKPRNLEAARFKPTASSARTSFNEAEAIKPRNLMNEDHSARHRSSFNEAEAIKPRNPRLTEAIA